MIYLNQVHYENYIVYLIVLNKYRKEFLEFIKKNNIYLNDDGVVDKNHLDDCVCFLMNGKMNEIEIVDVYDDD